jgi:GTP-binding protein EngB required for normal cell division
MPEMDERFLVFTGRPNSGKSSIIRKITGLNTRSGKRPGTTRRVSIYPLSRGLSLVDMPGYGRITGASIGTTSQVKDEILGFLENQGGAIALAVHVLDLSTFTEVSERMERKGIIPIDLEMIQYIEESTGEMPLVAANKIDKIRGNPEPLISELKERIDDGSSSEVECLILPLSAKTGEGLGILKDAIHRKLADEGFRTPFKRMK